MSDETVEVPRGRIAELESQCAELRIQNEMLRYHLEREKRWVRELERQSQELHALQTFPPKPNDPPLGWGKGKDE